MSKPIWQQIDELASLAGRHANKSYVAGIRNPADTICRRLIEARRIVIGAGVGTTLSMPVLDILLELVPVAKRLTKFTGIPLLVKRARIIAASLQRIAAEFILVGIEHGNITLAQEPRS